MKIVEVFVDREGFTSIPCPHCESTFRLSVARYQKVKHSLITKCTCKKRFRVNLNFRQFYRKPVNLAAEVKNKSVDSKDWLPVIVVNLSMGGLLFKVDGPTDIRRGHQLYVRFILDNQQSCVIDKEVRVVNIRDDHYGCEFLNLAYEEKELGYYLFPS